MKMGKWDLEVEEGRWVGRKQKTEKKKEAILVHILTSQDRRKHYVL